MRMTRHNLGAASLAVVVAMLGSVSLPATATAQTGLSTIAGVVADSTGGVLPGVTVEVSSPALIEGVRVAVSDGQGRYTITELRPGTYSVSFTLPGFSVFVREGLELPAAFTATVNAEMAVGSLEETITVAGESPVVDIQNVRQQNVFTRDELDQLPTTKSVAGFATLTLGASLSAVSAQTVGGDQSEALSSASSFSVHGSRRQDQKLLLNGMMATDASFSGNSNRNAINPIAAQETVFQVGGITAEGETGGVQINVIPREGSNSWDLYFQANGTNGDFQQENLSQAIKDTGLEEVPGVKKVYDVGYAVGGPVVRDKMWFFFASRWWGSQKFAPNNYFNATHDLSNAIGFNPTPGAVTTGVVPYNADLNQQAFTNGYLAEKGNIRITYQAAEKHKFSGSWNFQQHCDCRRDVDTDLRPEAVRQRKYGPSGIQQILYTYPASNRLLIEAGWTYSHYHSETARPPGTTTRHIGYTDQATGYDQSSAWSTNTAYAPKHKIFDQWNERFTVSYVTGSHSFKTGVSLQGGLNIDKTEINELVTPQGLAPVRYRMRTRGGVLTPNRVYQYTELQNEQRLRANLGLFVQDQWTMDRVTLNLGLRYSYFNAYTPAQPIAGPAEGRDDRTPTLFIADNYGPDGDIAPEVKRIPEWSDFTPRVGVAVDLFGTGKTALKASMGRYVAYEGLTDIPRANNPGRRLARSVRRSWNDRNGNYYPDCDLTNLSRNGECGNVNNFKFGQDDQTDFYADDVLLDNRSYNWQTHVGIEHELMPGLAFDVGYFRTSYGNHRAESNRLIGAANFTQFCVAVPNDPRLGSTSGGEICGFNDINPEDEDQLGAESFWTQASNFGDHTEVFDGVDIGVTGRFGDGGTLRGGVSMGRTETDNCDVLAGNPQIGGSEFGGADTRTFNGESFCNTVNSNQGQVKLAGAYPFPYGIEVSGTYQNLPGLQIAAFRAISDDEALGLGRDITDNDNVSIMKPFSEWGERINQVDLRLGKRFNIGGVSIKGQFDIYNLMNSGIILRENSTYPEAGDAGTEDDVWRNPVDILGGRLMKFGVLVEY